MKSAAKTPLRHAADATFHLEMVAKSAKRVEDATANPRATRVKELAFALRRESKLLEREVVR